LKKFGVLFVGKDCVTSLGTFFFSFLFTLLVIAYSSDIKNSSLINQCIWGSQILASLDCITKGDTANISRKAGQDVDLASHGCQHQPAELMFEDIFFQTIKQKADESAIFKDLHILCFPSPNVFHFSQVQVLLVKAT
jgi:hypothetical protein